MSDLTAPAPRPVSLITTLFVLALFAVFAFVVRHYYTPTASSPQNETAENLPKDLAWKATPTTRRDALATLRDKQAKQAVTYAWVDQKTGVVQLPIERAMELTVERYSAKK